MAKIAFIGLGNMGGPMAANLCKAQHHVAAFDLSDTAVAAAVEKGALPNVAKGALLIDCSTIDVESARHVAGLAKKAGLEMIDAPVSGGVGGATAGTLTCMVGGPE